MELVETIPAVLKNGHAKKMTLEHKTIYQVIYKAVKKILTKGQIKSE